MVTDTQNTDSFESKVNTLVSTIERDENGKLKFPEGTDEALQYAARTEIRRRDTQSALSQSKAEATRLQAENEQLASSWEADFADTLSPEENSRLEELKHQDPDKWHDELVKLKDGKRTKFQEKRKTISDEAVKVASTASRAEIFAAFEEKYPGVLTDDKLNNDIPPRMVKQLEEGKVDYKQFLQNCADYLTKDKVVGSKDDKPHKNTDLGDQSGGSSPDKAAATGQDSDDYAKMDW